MAGRHPSAQFEPRHREVTPVVGDDHQRPFERGRGKNGVDQVGAVASAEATPQPPGVLGGSELERDRLEVSKEKVDCPRGRQEQPRAAYATASDSCAATSATSVGVRPTRTP